MNRTMRKIAFRAWHTKLNKWIYFHVPIGFSIAMDEDIDFAKLGQFTGLTDKNGKEIYEGDIVTSGNFKGPVIFWRCSFGTGEGQDFTPLDQYVLEVIGNIYENPELLT